MQNNTTVHHLIDIYWSNNYNQKMIEETYKYSLVYPIFQPSLQKYLDLIEATQTNEKIISPFLIIEPYGDALEKLEPEYFSSKRAIYYKEITI